MSLPRSLVLAVLVGVALFLTFPEQSSELVVQAKESWSTFVRGIAGDAD